MRGSHCEAESMQLPVWQQCFFWGCIIFGNTVFPLKEVTYRKMLNEQFFHQWFSAPDGAGIFPDGTSHQTQTVKDWFHTEIVQR